MFDISQESEILLFVEKNVIEYIDNLEIDDAQKKELQQEICLDIKGRLNKIFILKQLNTKKNNYIDKETVKRLTNEACEQAWGKIDIAKILHILEKHIDFDFKKNKFVISGSKDKPLQISHFNFDSFGYDLHFCYCNFQVGFGDRFTIHKNGNSSFENCEFLEKIIFYKDEMLIKYTIEMKNCIFHKEVKSSNKIFNSNVYFNNSTFKDYTDFHESTFNKTACFYGVTFEKVPNFSACYFKEPKAVNLINVNIDDLDFNKVENFIENNFNDEQCKTEIKRDLTNQPMIEQKYKIKYAKNIKDSFRIIKDILITQNNTLDAQEWHKLELYAKEIEIETNLEKTHKSNRKQPLNQPKEINLVSLTIDKIILWLYRNTSFHHTNFTRILNFSLCMIVVYACMLSVFHLSMLYLDKTDLFYIKLLVLLISICYVGYKIKKIYTAIENILMLFLIIFGTIVLALLTYMHYLDILFFIALYTLSIIAIGKLYFSLIIQKSMLSIAFHYMMYLLLLATVIIKPQLINPFIGIFSSDKLFESKLETKLNALNPNIIIKLSKISQKEFIEYKINNDSFVEANEAKKVIVANRAELNDIISFVFNNKKIEYFKQILLTLENSPSDLAKIVKNIDDSNNNFAVLYDMTKLLNLDFTNNNNDINYNLNKKMSYLFITHSDEAYEIFNSKENQNKLKNIFSLINLDKSLHLQEIKQAIDYDIIISGTAKSTSIIYSIILLLCIFSLQKTARKNSIIPS